MSSSFQASLDRTARTWLGLPEGSVLPDAEELAADAREIVRVNFALLKLLAADKQCPSPIWEPNGGQTVACIGALPDELTARYYTGAGAAAITSEHAIDMVADIARWFADDPPQALDALADTNRFWCSLDAPRVRIGKPYKPHYKLLSLLIADLARKTDAGFDTLEWVASLSLPVDELVVPDSRTPEEVAQDTSERVQMMRAQEARWEAPTPPPT
jgi:hypothetical protein